MVDAMHAYYSARAPYMAKVVDLQPSGQVLEIVEALKGAAKDKDVLEVACGTGYWTRHVAPISRQTIATDFSDEMLAAARSQRVPRAKFVTDNAYALSNVNKRSFDLGYAMHWVSHIPMARWEEFFAAFHARLRPGATVVLADDIRRMDDTDPYYSKLADRDTYEVRRLPDGTTYEIVKTYFSPESLRQLIQPYAANLEINYERPRWWLSYQLKG